MEQRLSNKLIEVARSLIHLPQGKSRHLTFIVRRNRIITTGWCQRKTHTRASKTHEFPYLHSEVDAVVHFPEPVMRLRRCSLINVRLGKDGSLKMSKPCRPCQRFLATLDVGQVWYSTPRGFVRL